MRAQLIVVAIIGFLIAAIYGQSVDFGYVFDDEICILAPEEMREGLSGRGVLWALGSREHSNWFPLTRISWLTDVTLFGLDPGAAHLMNAFLHVTSALGLYAFLLSATGLRWQSCAVSAIFAVHPLQVESVAWITERSMLLSSLFMWAALAAHVAYVRRPGFGRYLAVFLCALLSLLAKPISVTLPVLLVLVDWWPLGRFRPFGAGAQRGATGSDTRWAILTEKAPLLLLSAGFGFAALQSQLATGSVASLGNLSFLDRIGVAASSVGWHVGKALYPEGLGVYYPLSDALASWWQTVPTATMIAVGTVAAFLMRRERPFILLGWLWFLVSLAPVSGLLQTGAQATADRFAHLPLVGFAIVLAWGCAGAVNTGPGRRLVVAGALAVVFALTALSFRQTGFWRDEVTLFSRAAAVTGADSSLIRYHLAEGLERAGRLPEAIENYRAALQFNRSWAGTRKRLGIVLAREGHNEEAEEHFRAALELDPRDTDARLNLGDLLWRTGRPVEAKEAYLAAVRMNPASAVGFERLASLLDWQGRTAASEVCRRHASTLDPAGMRSTNNLAHGFGVGEQPSDSLRGGSGERTPHAPRDRGAAR